MENNSESKRKIHELKGQVEKLKKELDRATNGLTEDKSNSSNIFNKKFEALFNAISDVAFVHPLKEEGSNNFIEVNEMACKLLGYSKEELLNMSLADISSPDDDETSGDKLNSKKLLKKVNTTFVKKDGSFIPVEISSHLVDLDDEQLIISVAKNLTEHMQLNKLLLESESQLNSITTAAPIGIGVVINRKLQSVNKQFIEIVGYSKDEVLGKDSKFLYINEEEYNRIGKEKYAQISKFGIGSAETKFKRKDGRIIDVLISSSPIETTDLSKGVVFTVSDITELRKTEIALQSSEEKNKSILTSMDDFVFVLDKNNVFQSAFAPEKLLLFSTEKFIGQKLYDVMPKYINDKFAIALPEMKAKGVASFEYKLEIDKHVKYFSAKISPIKEGKEYNGLVAVVRDVTGQKLAEQEFKLLADNTYDWEYWTDIDGNYKYVSPSCKKISGYSNHEFLDDYNLMMKILHPSFYEKVKQHFVIEKNKNEKTERLEFIIIDKNGTEHWVEHNCFPLYNEQGEFIGRRGNNRDITDKKEILNSLKSEKNKFYTLFNNHSAFKLLIDKETQMIVDANKAAIKFYGWPKEELLSMKISDINILSHEMMNEKIDLVESESTHFEFKHKLADGSIRDVETYPSLVELDGKVLIHSVIHDITEKKRAEKEIAKLSLAVEHSPFIVLITDTDGVIEYVNPKFSEITGYSMEEVRGKNPSILKSGEHPQEFYQNMWDTILDDKEWSGELHNKKKNGELYWESARISCLKDDNGKTINFVAVKEDITSRINNEKRIRKMGYILNETQAMAKVGGWEYKISEQRIIWTNEVYKIHGLPIGEMPALEDSYKFYHEDYVPLINKAFTKCVMEGEPYKLECKFFKANGEEIWVETSGKPIKDGNKIVKVVGNIADITSRKLQEIELAKLSQVTEQSAASIVVTNTDGDIEYVNPKFTEITGYSFNEAYGKNPRFLKSGKCNNEFYEKLWKTISGGSVWRGEFINKKKNGEFYWESASISPVKNKNGKTTHFVAIKEDITEKKNAENELKKEKEKAEVALDKAEKADRMKSIFLAQMSHEIRTPINTMVSTTSLMKYTLEEDADEDLMTSFDIVERAGERLIRTIDLLINLSEIQADTYEPLLTLLDIHSEILLPIIVDKKRIAKKKNVDLSINITASDTSVIADQYTVNQIFIQLIDNAIKYVESGEVRVNVRRNWENKLIVEVEDTGIGIEDEYQEHLFDAFSQEEMGYTRKYEGNGIGLALVKKYCEINKAKIEVESEKGVGSTFRIIFE